MTPSAYLAPDGNQAIRQQAYERRMAIYRAVEQGATRTEIARQINRSSSLVCNIYDKAVRQIRSGRKSPVEEYLDETPLAIKELARMLRAAKNKPFKIQQEAGRSAKTECDWYDQ